MEVRYPVCCGLDVHKEQVTACLRRVQSDGKVAKQVRQFGTTMAELFELSDWLRAEGCPVVAMESTGIYWRPIYHVLAGSFEVVVGNPADMKRRPGNKTDKNDADWISELLALDLIPRSFVPPPEIAALRDLTRLRVALVQTRAQAKNRGSKVLEDSNIKLGSVASDIYGVSGRRILDALVAGERDPRKLADLSVRTLRQKIPQLELALAGRFTEHHAAIVGMLLEQIDLLTAQIGKIERRIEEIVESFRGDVDRLDTIPGVDATAAEAVIAEIGRDMTRYESAGRLAAFVGLAPGNNESAGKRKSGKTRKGNRHVRRVLVECAWSLRRSENFLGRSFRRFQAKIGGKKAAVAVAHKILVIMYHLLLEGSVYEEERYDRLPQEERRLKNALKALRSMGYDVQLQKAESPVVVQA
jgi:transposase